MSRQVIARTRPRLAVGCRVELLSFICDSIIANRRQQRSQCRESLSRSHCASVYLRKNAENGQKPSCEGDVVLVSERRYRSFMHSLLELSWRILTP